MLGANCPLPGVLHVFIEAAAIGKLCQSVRPRLGLHHVSHSQQLPEHLCQTVDRGVDQHREEGKENAQYCLYLTAAHKQSADRGQCYRQTVDDERASVQAQHDAACRHNSCEDSDQ